MNTLTDMREAVFFEGAEASRKYGRFWILLTLASIIASAGVAGDSTATVIGAMIVAPLMTPILGVVLATVIAERDNLFRCWVLVIAGAAAAVAIGYVVGLTVPEPVVAETNTQVAARVSPHLIDLLAAVATGVVGAIALVRKDIADTLPGVAIAISLVPPLTVIGLTLEAQSWDQALGALLLFVTNVTAILAAGVVVMGFYRIRAADSPERDEERAMGFRRYRAVISIGVTLVIIGVPLAATSVRFAQQSQLETTLVQVTEPWAAENGWDVESIDATGDTATIRLTGEPPVPDTASLAASLSAQGIDPASITVEFIPAYTVQLEG